MDNIKEAFSKVREDTHFLKEEIDKIKENLFFLNKNLTKLNNMIQISLNRREFNRQTDKLTHKQTNQTNLVHSSTHINPLKPSNTEILDISKGNVGVPTNQQTNKPTNQQTQKEDSNPLESALGILHSLDNLKKELRLKFKRLTEQELFVFSKLYQLDEEVGFSDYKTLSKQLNLTESSIRDYIGRLIKKGIPIEKTKINNKNIQLKISNNLKKIATLSTILQLREI